MSEESKRRAGLMRLEDWLDERITVNLNRGSRPDPPSEEDEEELVEVEASLEGVDTMGVIVHFSPSRDVSGSQDPDMRPRYVFYPWRRIESIERIEAEE
jgi:hypothetical protein